MTTSSFSLFSVNSICVNPRASVVKFRALVNRSRNGKEMVKFQGFKRRSATRELEHVQM
jgi:hypothetical protein